ncbi:hypothetical protein EIP91_002590 [Steccherinum ochraceum]|uniref:Vacuolar protein sorting-associated protein ist1 n=1 Tax=Steccherinum ochraceum TaxID=92696 RepID=A0A4R0RDQ7_9APHY|nr:hypothetical protein EIP91_002590 [Steccherinum ochraceum]
MVPWNSAKAKVQLRLGVQRLRTLQEKKQAQAKASRRDIAFLLEKGKLETARIKVENIINEDIYVELLELLELYCELLISRFSLLDQNVREPDAGVAEGVTSIIFASPRTELKELHVLRDLLMHKYGRDFALSVMDNKDECVPTRVVTKLKVETPSKELVDAYLREIAKGYGVPWADPASSKDDDGDGGDDGGVKSKYAADPFSYSLTLILRIPKKNVPPLPGSSNSRDGKALRRSTRGLCDHLISAEARSAGVRTPKLPEVPPSKSDDASSKAAKEEEKTAPVQPAPAPAPAPGTVNDFDALAARFAALKKR